MGIEKISNGVRILVDLKGFIESPGPNCMSFGFSMKRLINSIEAVGLINIPFVTRNREGRLDIVAGYRRIMALKAMGYDRVHCMDLSDSGLTALEMLLFNLYDNITIRRFNEVEKGMILNHLMLYMSREDIVKHYMQLLDIKNQRELDILMRIDEFDETTKKFIADGDISTNTIGLINELDNRSRSVILKWILALRLNFNQQLKYIDYIIDISMKEGKSIDVIMDEDQFLRLLEDKDLNTPQKARKMLKALRIRRFPFLTNSEREFEKRIKGLRLPSGINIRHSPFFEGQDYLLEIAFKDGKELKEKVDILARTEGLNAIKDPWREDL